ncbi:MAG: hypothetical protein GWN62_07280 [Aliifodinibius sp.]|nr:hypothetical protein [Fodinibius sp.]
MFDKNNWFMLDEILPKRWCTRKLKDAVIEFLAAKTLMRQGAYEKGFLSQVSALQ